MNRLMLFLASVLAKVMPGWGACVTQPIMGGADPAVIYTNGYFYSLRTTGGDVRIRRSTTLGGMASGTEVTVFTPNAEILGHVWAPELHFLDGKWYAYSCGTITSGATDQRMFVLEANSTNPMGSYTFKGIMDRNLPAIDESPFHWNGTNYLFWSGFDDAGQSLYVAPLVNPWTLGAPRVRISSPTRSWERNGNVNEGPWPFTRHGRLFVVYSASGCWTDDYTLGLLELTGTDLLTSNHWTKTGPHFLKQPGAYGPGHNSVVQDAAGQWWNVHHANTSSGQGCGGARNLRAQRLYWNADGTPFFGVPVPAGSIVNEAPDFLVARFPLNEAGGTTANNTACGGDGAVNGPATWTHPGLAFNGSNTFLLGDAAVGNDVQFSLTLAAWIRPEAFQSYAGIITKGTNLSPWALQLAGSGALRFSANFGSPPGAVGGGVWDSGARLTTGSWQHVAVTYDGARLRFYVNGRLDSNSPSVSLRFGLANEPLVLGADFPGGDEFFRGAMREARVYGRALSRSEIIGLAGTALIPAGATWKYLDQTNNPGTAWREPDYNDGAWFSGPARLGYGGDGEVTQVTSNRARITTWFRHSFLAEPAGVGALGLHLARDDGAVVYLNGTEVWRDNMPAGAIDYLTRAATTVSGADETTFFSTNIGPGLLRAGTNVLAVEVHQVNISSSDLGFDFELTALPFMPGNQPPTVALAGLTNLARRVAPITLEAEVYDDEDATARVEFLADGVRLGEVAAPPYALAWPNPAPGPHAVWAVATDALGASAASPVLTILVDSAFIPAGASWRYNDTGANPGTAWRGAGFDDRAWPAGPAELGFGDGDEATVVSNRLQITTCFRRQFTVVDAANYAALVLRLVRDDGAVVYLNGTELWRDNLPAAGEINFNTPASAGVGGVDESLWHIRATNAAALRTGTNLLAVEVHQSSTNSSDLSFNFELIGELALTPAPLAAARVGNRLQLAWPVWAGGCALVSATNLAPPVTWAPVTNAPVFNGGEWRQALDAVGGQRFYRLVTP
jgi:GH43 family beta-xylosidase